MKRFAQSSFATLLLATAGLAGCTDQSGSVTTPSAPSLSEEVSLVQNSVIADQYIVVFRNSVTDAAGLASRLVGLHGGTVLHVYTHALKGFAATLPASAVPTLAAHPEVEQVEQDGMVYPTGMTTQSNATWGLDRVDQRDLPLNGTYRYSLQGRNVNVYVIDSGIRYAHQEFGGRATLGTDYVNDGVAQQDGDCNGHGTHVAGTIGGTTWGIAKQARLIAVRIFPCSGGSPRSRTIAAVDWVTANAVKPAVVNMSLGGNNEGYPNLSTLDRAVENSIASGLTYAVAAGNESIDACTRTPARAPLALTVGSIARGPLAQLYLEDVRSSFSNWGTCVDLFAPGSSITSAGFTNNTGSRTISGTSMATPHVAGVAALYLEAYPAASPGVISSAIVRNATPGKVADAGEGSPNLLLHSIAPVDLDIKPGSPEPKSINQGAEGMLPVAILTGAYQAEDVNPASIRLSNGQGRGTALARHSDGRLFATLEDVNQDGRLDLVLHFSMQELRANGDLTASTTALHLSGTLRDAWPVRGSNTVRIVP